MRNYSYELQVLRSAAIAEIKKYIAREGSQAAKTEDGKKYIIKIDEPYLVINGASATTHETKLLCDLATAFGSIVPQRPAQAPKQIPNIRLPYKDE